MYSVYFRYFGSAEGSRFVEYTSANSVKRTWVNYGMARDWMDSEQGQVCVCVCVCLKGETRILS